MTHADERFKIITETVVSQNMYIESADCGVYICSLLEITICRGSEVVVNVEIGSYREWWGL